MTKTIFILLLGFSALALTKPTPTEIDKVVDYYLKGGGGPIVSGFKVCTEVATEGDQKNECVQESTTVSVGENAFIWTKFFAPQGQRYTNLRLQLNRSGVTMASYPIKVNGALRYRIYRKFRPDKAGDWEVVILNETATGFEELKKMTVTVQ